MTYETILNKDELKKFAYSDVRINLGVYFDFYLFDQEKCFWSYEMGTRIRVVNDPYFESMMTITGNLKKDIMWSIAWESDEECDQETDPWDLPSFPVIFYPTIDEIFKYNPLT